MGLFEGFGNAPYRCKYCGETFQKKEEYEYHRKNHAAYWAKRNAAAFQYHGDAKAERWKLNPKTGEFECVHPKKKGLLAWGFGGKSPRSGVK